MHKFIHSTMHLYIIGQFKKIISVPKILLLMVLAIYGKATLVLSAISKFHFFSARYSSRSFCHRAMNEVSKRAA